MNYKVIVNGIAIMATFAGVLLAQGTTQAWFDHKAASGCRHLKNTAQGIELSFHHLAADIPAGASVTWDDSSNAFYMDRDIKVYGDLTVKPGNWIYGGQYATLDDGSFSDIGASLIIMEGGKAHMIGTKDSTIVMTGLGDDFRDINSFGPGVKGMWGGLIIKGKAPVSNAGWNGWYPMIVGIAPYEPDSIWYFGNKGNDPMDNSGEYTYLSMRHGGGRYSGTRAGASGLNFYAVGAGTTVNHIEVMSCYGDATVLNGGTVNLKYICNSFCGDDMFDIDQGYCGKIQYALGVQSNWMGNRGAEWDGKKHYDDPNPTSNPTICNMTLISCGKYSTNNKNDQNYGAMYLMQIADSLKGDFRNIIALDGTKYAFWMRNHDLRPSVQNNFAPGQAALGAVDGPKVSGFMVYNTGTVNNATAVWDSLITDDNGATSLTQDLTWLKAAANKNSCNIDPKLRGVSREFNFAALDPRPCAGSPALTNYVANPSDGFFDQANYVGAFGTSDIWADGWTKLSQNGCLSGYLSTFPENAIVPYNATFDLCWNINDPKAVTTNAKIYIDGVDQTVFYLNKMKANNGPLPAGGFWVKVPGFQPGAVFTTANYPGLHVIKTVFTMDDGRIFTGYNKIKVTY